MKNVAIFGWFGGTMKLLNIYKQFYEKLGAKNVIIYKNDILQSITYSGWIKQQKNAPFWANQDIDTVAIFSGGVFPYYNFRIANKHLNFMPKKIIYDSGIFLPKPNQVTRYIKEGIIQNYQHMINDETINQMIIQYWKSENYNWKKELPKFIDNINCDASKIIINSIDDPFIVRSNLDDLIKNSTRGTIKEYLFEKSMHVQHYKYHKEEYTQIVNDFIK